MSTCHSSLPDDHPDVVRDHLLNTLRFCRRPMSVGEMAEACEITPAAARRQLDALISSGDIQHRHDMFWAERPMRRAA